MSVCFLVRCGLICSYTYERGCSSRCCVVGSIDCCRCRLFQYAETELGAQTRTPLSLSLGSFCPLASTSVSALFNFGQSSQCSEKMCDARRPYRLPSAQTPQALSKETAIPRSSRRPHTCLGAQNLTVEDLGHQATQDAVWM